MPSCPLQCPREIGGLLASELCRWGQYSRAVRALPDAAPGGREGSDARGLRMPRAEEAPFAFVSIRQQQCTMILEKGPLPGHHAGPPLYSLRLMKTNEQGLDVLKQILLEAPDPGVH